MKKNFKYSLMFLIGLLQISIGAQEVITPEKAVKIALENNYGIKLAYTDVHIAENNADILNSGYLPTVTGNAGASFTVNDVDGETAQGPISRGDVESSRYNASVDLNYVLFDGLGRSYNYKQLKETKQLTELQARATIENTILQLFTVYYNVAEMTENIGAIEQSFAISKDRLLRAKYQFDYGQSTKLDVLNAEVDVNNDSITVMNSKQQLRNFKRDLNLVLGNTLNNEFDIDSEIAFNTLYDKEELIQKALSGNVSIMLANKGIAMTELGVKNQRSAYLPTIGLIGSYGWNQNNNPASFTTEISTVGLTGGLNLRWNLFDGGNTITRVNNAKLNLEAQQIEKERILVTLERDFNNAWENYLNRLEIFKLQEDNIKTAQNNFNRTEEKFKLGQVNSIQFRLAQVNLLNAEVNRNRAKYAAKIAELEMLQISGDLLNTTF
ncbi:TolC family protein [Tamlana fucoidanivorans]|uniref:TolC family protein n=1 Tax=Allotamlana fucoidanivorans TaxID=2583814 RepID=A0A5C4SJS2_9FLAO|nr:TolC family protein [Tamlana fucoidanivorans]TNJ43693.1 TolC family protein [Tamlana fucoidanivorans]